MISSNVEDVEMRDAEDDEDDEDAVAEELGLCSLPQLSIVN